jgi:hypothetical protein
VWGWLWSGDPDGEALFLFHFGPCRPRRVRLWRWLWSSDPDGEALFLLYFGTGRPRRVSVLGWLWSSDRDGEALFLLHFGPITDPASSDPYPFTNARMYHDFLGIYRTNLR